MDEEYCQIRCPKSKYGKNAHDNCISYGVDEESRKCSECGEKTQIIPYDKITEPEVIIEMAESDLESANHHSMTSLPSDLFSNIKRFVTKENHAKLARVIASCCTNNS